MKHFFQSLKKRYIVFGILGLIYFARAVVFAADDASFGSPNSEQELRLQKIFDKYNKEPVDDDKWQSMLGARGSESYKIQTGDTLWDLSETMFGDGSYWPKLWSENRSIENPHQIIPKKRVQFIAGNEAQAPSIRIVENEAPKPYYVEEVHESLTAEEIAGGTIIEDPDVIGRRPEIPPMTHRTAQVLRSLPPSFKVEVASKHTGDFDKDGLDVGIIKALREPATVTLNSFLSTDVPRKLGFVKEIETQEKTAAILQNVYLELGRKVKVGDRLNVVVMKSELEDSEGKKLGHIIDVNGSVEVTDIVNEEDGIYKAIIVDCVMPIELNASVTDEPLPKASFAPTGNKKHIEGQIVGGEYSEHREMFGTASVVYINIGTDAGVKEGDLLAVRSIRKSRREDTELKDVGRPIGVIKVAKVSQNAATALVLNTIDEIKPGDKIGGEFPVQKEYRIGSRADKIDVDKIGEDKNKDENYTEEFDNASGASSDKVKDKDIDLE